MKIMQMTRLWIIASCLILLGSCADFKNDIYIHEDGSGKVSMTYDASEMMGMIEMIKNMEEMEDQDSNQEEPSIGDGDDDKNTESASEEESKDPLARFMSSMTSAKGPTLEMNMDTTINFYEEMSDSIKSKLSNPELLKNVNVTILADKSKSKMVMGMALEYKSLDQLSEMYSEMSKLSENEGNMGQTINSFKDMVRNYEADFDNGIITLPEQDFKGSMGEMMDSGMGMGDSDNAEDQEMMNMMLGDAGIVTTIHLPYKVISCDDTEAKIEENTITITDKYVNLVNDQKMKARSIRFNTK